MALLDILEYPDPRLHVVARPVERFDDALQRLIDDMAQTMYEAPGIGLAATQVNVPLRLALIDISEARDGLQVFINPEIISREGEQTCEEGCLSVPGVYDTVTRAERVVVRALDRHGKPFELAAEGMLAVCMQHEFDHLDGKVFVERLSRLKQSRIRTRLAKRDRRRDT
jgi:peptide deformylase